MRNKSVYFLKGVGGGMSIKYVKCEKYTKLQIKLKTSETMHTIMITVILMPRIGTNEITIAPQEMKSIKNVLLYNNIVNFQYLLSLLKICSCQFSQICRLYLLIGPATVEVTLSIRCL